MRPVYEGFARASRICTNLDFFPHLDLGPERVELESAKSAMIIVTEGVI